MGHGGDDGEAAAVDGLKCAAEVFPAREDATVDETLSGDGMDVARSSEGLHHRHAIDVMIFSVAEVEVEEDLGGEDFTI